MSQVFLPVTVAVISALVTFAACFCYVWQLLLSDNEARAVAEAMRMFRDRDGEKSPNSYRLGRLLDRHGFVNKGLVADEPEWISVADKLPEERVDVLVSAEYDTDIPFSYDSMYVCQLFKGRWLEGTEHNTIEGVTHWRYLPLGPKRSAVGGSNSLKFGGLHE